MEMYRFVFSFDFCSRIPCSCYDMKTTRRVSFKIGTLYISLCGVHVQLQKRETVTGLNENYAFSSSSSFRDVAVRRRHCFCVCVRTALNKMRLLLGGERESSTAILMTIKPSCDKIALKAAVCKCYPRKRCTALSLLEKEEGLGSS